MQFTNLKVFSAQGNFRFNWIILKFNFVTKRILCISDKIDKIC